MVNQRESFPIDDIPIQECPHYHGKVYTYTSAIAMFYAPSDLSGVGGTMCKRI
ncbi:hypothetical protein EDD85DRAFT_777972 [Armillaria nabsnona]|nr:hypothetical protein EDD85DRAFT_777972 [Armillaria nabsnona]